jgi:hypothetical protein
MPLCVCFIASEVAPLAKTGGLADVAGALGKYLHAAGHDVRVFMPLYRQVDRRALQLFPVGFLRDIPLQLGAHTLRFSVLTARLPGSQAMIYLIDAPALFDRAAIYGNAPDEHLRFLLLTHAALVSCQHMGFSPQILHAMTGTRNGPAAAAHVCLDKRSRHAQPDPSTTSPTRACSMPVSRGHRPGRRRAPADAANWRPAGSTRCAKASRMRTT